MFKYYFNGMTLEIDIEISDADPTIGEPKPYVSDIYVVSVNGHKDEAICDYIAEQLDFSDVVSAYKQDKDDY